MKPQAHLQKSLLASLLLTFTFSVYSQKDWNNLAKKVVENAGIQPGEVVVVNAGQHTIPLAEAITIESNLRGAFTTVFFNTDNIERSLIHEVPVQYLSLPQTFFGEWVKQVDVWIGLPTVENSDAIYKDAKEDRMVALRTAGQKLYDGFNNSKVRLYSVNYPTPQRAAQVKMEYPVYEKMVFDAMQADYKRIAGQAESLKKLLTASKNVTVTSPAGTRISFSVSGRPVTIYDGVTSKEDVANKLLLMREATLPDGRVFVTAVETSVNGKVIVPRDECRYAPITNISFDVKNGKMENFKADQGADCFLADINVNTGAKDIFAGLSIGLNPALKTVAGSDFLPVNGEGIVHLSFGNNQLVGGTNKSTFNWAFPVLNATVEIDGKTVVKDGKLVL